MAPTLSGRIVKSRRGKTGVQKNTHRWESFTNKISKLHSLDPLRKVRRYDLDTEDLDTTTSYFRNGLEKWADLDISKNFTSFRREVFPLCESLPQILHFEGKIMNLLEQYISKQEKESLESLLDLLTAFAHDLGVRFEKYYTRALVLITEIAGRRHDADVIEWTFASLAFLFKYLSRLLVFDIRPTYDVMAPLLGKARNPPHIARFAAEAMSFLVKKAAAPSNREKALPLIIDHARLDFQKTQGDRQHELYYHGLMTMFAEAIKGRGNGVHTTGPAILNALIVSVSNEDCRSEETNSWSDLVCGVVVSIVHHTTADSFASIAQSICEQRSVDKSCEDYPLRDLLYVRLVGTLSGARKGTRISDWQTLLGCLKQSLYNLCREEDILASLDSSTIWQHVLVNVAIVWQHALMDSVLPYIADLMKTLTRDPLMKWFIPFCSYFSELDASRFRSLFLRHFQKFVLSHWSEDSNEDMLCVLLPRMVQSGALPSTREAESFALPQSWQDQIVTKFERLEISPFPEEGASAAYDKDPKIWRDRCLPKYAALLDLLECTAASPSTMGPISDILLRKLKLALRPSLSIATHEARFIVSQGFSAYLGMSKAASQLDKSLGPLLRAAAPRYHRLVGFLEAMLAYEEEVNGTKSSCSGQDRDANPEKDEDPLLNSLVDNLSSQSSQLRLVSLKLLDKLYPSSDQLDVLETMIQTEQTPHDIHNVRVIAAHTRKLSSSYSQLDETSWRCRAVPAFLFGMVTVRLKPVWESAIEALKQIGETKIGEDLLCDYALEWLEVPSVRWNGSGGQVIAPSNNGLTDFECLNLMQLHAKAGDAKQVIDGSVEIILQIFDENQKLVPGKPNNARSQALRVLSANPHLAEKRSRRLVPIFLTWTSDADDQADTPDDETEKVTEGSWSLADRKALLSVFSQFSNPKVLFQSQQVYEALLKLLANGDVDIQKDALKAILAWKKEGLKPYQENLEFLLDEARFKNELTVLFQGDRQIQPEHRPEMMPVLLRLLYGRTISKRGVASGRGGLQATRHAVLRHLSSEDMGSFLDIALGELRGVTVVQNSRTCEEAFSREIITVRKQVGVLNMMSAMINELGSNVSLYVNTILNAVLYSLVLACRKLQHSSEEDAEEGPGGQSSLLRAVRATALKCVVSLLQNASSFNWALYKDILIKEVISPRLPNLAVENTQGISGTFQLLSTLSALPQTALFLAIDDRVVGKLLDCLSAEKTKDEVKVFALGIVRNLVKLAQAPATEYEFNELIKEELLDPNLEKILGSVGGLLSSLMSSKEPGKELLSVCIESIVELAPIVQSSKYIPELVDISVFLLNRPSRHVNPKMKSNVLLILENFLQAQDLGSKPELRERIYSTISSLYGFFNDRPNREALSRVLTIFARGNQDILEIAIICADLNSFDERRIDVPDYERRLAAYSIISKPREIAFTPKQWLPLLHNMSFYIKRDEEYGILSSNSADAICRFVDAVSSCPEHEKDDYHDMLSNIAWRIVTSGARDSSEIVRRETVRILGYLVSHMPTWSRVEDLDGLEPPPDDRDSDPSFFNNILSPATSRQIRALQLLSKVSDHADLSSDNAAHFFIPLLDHFIFGREEGSDDHGVGAEATTTIAKLAMSLEWSQFRALLGRYIGYIETRPQAQKQLVRLLGKLIDTLAIAIAEGNDDGAMVIDGTAQKQVKKRRLSCKVPEQKQFSDEVVFKMLPPLLDHMHDKDETTVSSRVPFGVIVVKLLKLLPAEIMEQKLPGALTDICHILRSKATESREMARNTLASITSILGPSCFGFVLNELRGALTKGYQLHVLSYTMHTILVHATPQFQSGDLDYCLDKIVTVIMDDIFGAVGQEKDAEEYVSKMKEVKSSKSQDSMELVAKITSIDHLAELVRPLQSLLMERLDLRMTRKIDELLTRITNGLLSNEAAASRDTLVFCYEVIQQVYKSEAPQEEPKLDPKIRRYLVQKGAKKSGERGSTSKHTYKLVRFALEILRSLFKKHDSLRTSGNIAGFLPILGDAVVGGQEEVRIAAFKLLTVIVKVPFKTDEMTMLYNVAAKEATKSIIMSVSTTTDLAQTALKFTSVTLRDRRDVVVKDMTIDKLLGKLKDDLTEPLYRHVTFNFLRSVIDRKIETAVVYDTLDHVGTVMITNDDKDTRDLARGAFFQFLRDYPQKKNRWDKQLKFVVANLQYDREGGRLSVMEIIHLLLMKSADDFVQEVATDCFIPLFLRLANDESEKCRLAAGELIKEIFRKADKERTSKFLNQMRKWLAQEENQTVLRLAIQLFGFYFEAKEEPSSRDQKDAKSVTEKMIDILGDQAKFADDWELINTIMQTIPVLMQKFPPIVLANEQLWHAIGKPLASSNADVKLSSIRLLNTYLADFYEHGKQAGGAGGEMTGSHGLRLERDAIAGLVVLAVGILSPNTIARWRKRTAKKVQGVASDELAVQPAQIDVNEVLAAEVIRTLAMLGKFLDPKPSADDENGSKSDEDENAEQEEMEDEEEDEWGGINDEEDAGPKTKTSIPPITLHTLFTLLSDILIVETPARSSALVAKETAMDLVTLYIATLPPTSHILPSLNMVLMPLHHLTDPTITVPISIDDGFKKRYDELQTKARENMDAVQRKLGVEVYTNEMLRIREAARRRREGRAKKRKIEAVAQPEKYGKWKRGRLDKKVKRRKEKSTANKEKRRGARF